jgi:DNA-binding CsgD family transcriptional regulator/uncharacterized membrane protein YvlD (DUF360 family)
LTTLLRLPRASLPLVFASASYVAAVAAVFAVDDPAVAPSLLLAIPIAVFTCAVGLHAGVVAAVIAMLAVIVHWETSDLSLGAAAYLTRGIAFSSIPALIVWARQSRSPASDDGPASEPARIDSATRAAMGLSRRELQVLQLVALGHTNPEIAAQLYISVRTVEGHRARVQRKLGCSGRAELVRYALQRKLIGTQA